MSFFVVATLSCIGIGTGMVVLIIALIVIFVIYNTGAVHMRARNQPEEQPQRQGSPLSMEDSLRALRVRRLCVNTTIRLSRWRRSAAERVLQNRVRIVGLPNPRKREQFQFSIISRLIHS